MENASKALIIAGGMLIAIILISMFLMMYNKMASIEKAKQEKTMLEQIESFNAGYESYNKKMMYGADVVTLRNKVNEYNRNNTSEKITITFPEEFNNFDEKSENEKEELLKKRYKCTRMEYGNSGKVSNIKIESIN